MGSQIVVGLLLLWCCCSAAAISVGNFSAFRGALNFERAIVLSNDSMVYPCGTVLKASNISISSSRSTTFRPDLSSSNISSSSCGLTLDLEDVTLANVTFLGNVSLTLARYVDLKRVAIRSPEFSGRPFLALSSVVGGSLSGFSCNRSTYDQCLSAYNSSLSISNMVAQGGHAVEVLSYSSIVVANSSFLNCSGGSTVHASGENISLSIRDCEFLSSVSFAGTGGAIGGFGLVGSTISILRSSFVRCSAVLGGAIGFVGVSGSTVQMDSLAVLESVAQKGGCLSLQHWTNSNLELTNSTFNDCSASSSGGDIYLYNLTNVFAKLDRNSFLHNLVDRPSYGGVLFASTLTSSQVLIERTTVAGARASTSGGALYLTSLKNSALALVGGRFAGLRAGYGAVAYAALFTESSFTMQDAAVEDAQASVGGSFMRLNTLSLATVHVANCTLSGLGETGPSYGAIYASTIADSAFALSNSSLSECDASHGGSVMYLSTVTSSTFDVLGSQLRSLGQVVSPSYGGAFVLYKLTDSGFSMRNSLVTDSDAGSGAVFYCGLFESTNLEIVGTTFERIGQNLATSSGGVAFVSGITGGGISIRRVTVSESDVSVSGAVLYLHSSTAVTVNVENSLFRDLGQYSTCAHGCALRIAIAEALDFCMANTSITRSDGTNAGIGFKVSDLTTSKFSLTGVTLSRLGELSPAAYGAGTFVTVADSSIAFQDFAMVDCQGRLYSAGLFLTGLSNTTVSVESSVFARLGEGSAPQYGAAIYLEQSTGCRVFVNNTTFTRCQALSSGGGVYLSAITHTAVTFERIVASETQASTSGGWLFAGDVSASSIEILESSFTDLGAVTTPMFGGALYFSDISSSCTISIDGTAFLDVQASLFGGCLCVRRFASSSFSVCRSTFVSRNQTVQTSLGGGIFASEVWEASVFEVAHSSFKGFDGQSGCGIQLSEFADIQMAVTNCDFLSLGDPLVTSQGAGMMIMDGNRSSLVVENSRFLDNVGSSTGGSMIVGSLFSTTVFFRNCSFLGSSASQFGGAMALLTLVHSQVEMKQLVIDGFGASSTAAGMYLTQFANSSLALEDIQLSHLGQSVTPRFGGAVLISEWTACSATMNHVDVVAVEASTGGAGLFVTNVASSNLSISNLSVREAGKKSFPDNGAGLYLLQISKSKIELDSVVVTEAESNGAGAGLSLLFLSDSVVSCRNCSFFALGKVSAPRSGGCIYVGYGTRVHFALEEVECFDANAKESGGALSVFDVQSSSIDVQYSSFSDLGLRFSPGSAGAIGFSNSTDLEIKFSHCVFDNCRFLQHAGGVGLFDLTGFSLGIHKCIFERMDDSGYSIGVGGSLLIQRSRNGNVGVSFVSAAGARISDEGEFMALHGVDNVTAEISSCSVACAGAPRRGGGINLFQLTGSTVAIQDTLFTDCSSTARGGSISMLTLQNSVVLCANVSILRSGKAVAPQVGGGIFGGSLQNSSLFLIESRLLDCQASESGAVVHIEEVFDNSSVVLRDCTLSGARSPWRGGLISAAKFSNSVLTIEAVSGNSSLALEQGGGVWLQQAVSSTISVMRVNLTSAGTVVSQSGGLFYFRKLEHCNLNISRSFFSGGESSISGAGADLSSLTSCVVTLETVGFSKMGMLQQPQRGGALSIQQVQKSSLTVVDVSVEDVSGRSGGGVFFGTIGDSSIRFDRVNILRSGVVHTGEYGGAMLFLSLVNVSLSISEGFFAECQATVGGAGISFDTVWSSTVSIDKNTTFRSLVGSEKGGGILLSNWIDSSFHLADSSLNNCEASTSGAAIAIHTGRNSVVSLVRVELVQNGVASPPTKGGSVAVWMWPAGVLSMDDCLIRGSRAVQFGGGLFSTEIDRVNLSNCTFQFQTAGLAGGAIYVQDIGRLSISDTRILDGETKLSCPGCGGAAIFAERVFLVGNHLSLQRSLSSGNGGGMLIGALSRVELEHLVVRNCSAVRSGGGIFIDQSVVSIKGALLSFARAGRSGAAIRAIGSEVELHSCRASELRSLEGAFLAASRCERVTVSNSTASSLHVEQSGGAILIDQSTAVSLSDVVISDSVAIGNGGAVAVSETAAMNVSALRIRGASAAQGGAMWISGSAVAYLDDSRFENCSALHSGGGLSVVAGSLVRGSNILVQRCFAENGGGVSAEKSTLDLHSSALLLNQASSKGGAVNAEGCAVEFSGSSIEANTALLGGGVFCANCQLLRLRASSFELCSSPESGGGVYTFSSSSPAIVKVESSSFKLCSGAQYGGAIALFGVVEMTADSSCSFDENSAMIGGAVYCEGPWRVNGLENATHSSNVPTFAATGPAFLRIDPSTFDVASRSAFAVTVTVVDRFGSVVKISDRIVAMYVSGQSVVSGAGAIQDGKVLLNSVRLDGTPGTSGFVRILLDGDGLEVTVPYNLRNCTQGELWSPLECMQCNYGSFSMSVNASSCLPCPTGAVCVNGSSVFPQWGYWTLPGLEGGEICRGGECRLPVCAVDDVCFGAVDLQLGSIMVDASSGVVNGTVLYGCSASLQRAVSLGATDVLIGRLLWMQLGSLDCHTGSILLRAARVSAELPLWSSRQLLAQVFVSPVCSEGYMGPLCSVCSSGFGKNDQKCEKCNSGFVSILLALVAALLFAGVLSALAAMTISAALPKYSSKHAEAVAVAKIVWSYVQLLDLCHELPMGWPRPVAALFRFEEAIFAVNSAAVVSLDCVFGAAPSLLSRSLFVYCITLLLIALSKGGWWLRARLRAPSGIPWGDRFRISAVTVYFFLFPSLCRSSFSLFPCQEVGTEKWAMTYDLSVSCSSGQYFAGVLVGVLGTLVFAIGIPAVLLWRARGAAARSSLGVLLREYKDKFLYYDSCVFLKKALFVSCVVFQQAAKQPGSPLSTVSVATCLWLLVPFYVLQMHLSPYQSTVIDRLERLSALSIMISVFSRLLVHQSSVLSGVFVGTVLIGANLGVLALALTVLCKLKSHGVEKKVELANVGGEKELC